VTTAKAPDGAQSSTIRVGVLGGTGHAGREACRLLLGHPHIEIAAVSSLGRERFEEANPNLRGSGLVFVSHEELLRRAGEMDAVVCCTPAGVAMTAAREALERGARVVDLSPDFRFPDVAEYERIYGGSHVEAGLAAEAAPGLTEFHRDLIRPSRLVANPGCYVITAALALTPLAASGTIATGSPIFIAALNGTSGAGGKAHDRLQHGNSFGATLAYSLSGHRHRREMELAIERASLLPVAIDLSTAHGNFARGIFLQATVPLPMHTNFTRDELLDLYRSFYGDGHRGEHFVVVNDAPRRGERNDKEYGLYPSPTDVLGSNACHIGVDVDREVNRAKIVAVTDNLGKGAAGSAVQNLNVMFGFSETSGLTAYGL
jgi:N-acetyl-gamma-glutamyl-phosphate reductase